VRLQLRLRRRSLLRQLQRLHRKLLRLIAALPRRADVRAVPIQGGRPHVA
jgi:hypothetical protein